MNMTFRRRSRQPTQSAADAERAAFERESAQEKHRKVVIKLLSMTLTEDNERALLYDIVKAFDLPLVIGEQFICKIKPFQSPSYHACLEFSLTTLWNEKFARSMWIILVGSLDAQRKCQLYFIAADLQTRKFHLLHEYDKCFVGRECIAWLVSHNFAMNRELAVELGTQWLNKKYIVRVDNRESSHFRDDHYFYQFYDDYLYDRDGGGAAAVVDTSDILPATRLTLDTKNSTRSLNRLHTPLSENESSSGIPVFTSGGMSKKQRLQPKFVSAARNKRNKDQNKGKRHLQSAANNVNPDRVP